MVAAGTRLINSHTVGTDQTVNQGLNAYRPLACLAVGDDYSGLYDVTRNYLGSESGIDYFDIHVVIREITALIEGVRHLLNNGQGDLGNVDVVDTPVTVAEKCPGPTVDGADHALLWPLLEPGVDILGQQADVALEHPFIILPGDIQVAAHLAVSSGQDVQWLHPVNTRVVQKPQSGDTVAGFHVQISRVYQIVCLGLTLTHDLLCRFLNGDSLFHFVDPSLSLTMSRRCSRLAPWLPVHPAPEAPPAWAKDPWPGS